MVTLEFSDDARYARRQLLNANSTRLKKMSVKSKILDQETAESVCDALVDAGLLHDFYRNTAVIILIGLDNRDRTAGIYSDEEAYEILQISSK